MRKGFPVTPLQKRCVSELIIDSGVIRIDCLCLFQRLDGRVEMIQFQINASFQKIEGCGANTLLLQAIDQMNCPLVNSLFEGLPGLLHQRYLRRG